MIESMETVKDAIKKATNKESLTRQEMEAAMEEIMAGEATSAQIGALLTALKMKGETVAEILEILVVADPVDQ